MKVRCINCRNERNVSCIELIFIKIMIWMSNFITKTDYNYLFYIDDNETCCKKPYYLEVI